MKEKYAKNLLNLIKKSIIQMMEIYHFILVIQILKIVFFVKIKIIGVQNAKIIIIF